MVMYSVAATLLVLSGAVSAIKLNQPRATPVNKNYPANGWTPKPTTKPRPLLELFRRQEDPAFCGYLDGDGDFPITCDLGSSCLMDDVYSWFGCCTGTRITDCEVATACVRSAAIDDCLSDSSCANDPLAMACTSKDQPYCAWLYTKYSGSMYGHFICAASSTSFEVVSTSSGGFKSTFSVTPDTETDFPTSTRRTRTTAESDDKTETGTATVTAEDDDTTESDTSTRTSARPSTADETTTTQAPQTRVNVPTSSNAAAVRTAEAVAGAVGGAAGLLALLF